MGKFVSEYQSFFSTLDGRMTVVVVVASFAKTSNRDTMMNARVPSTFAPPSPKCFPFKKSHVTSHVTELESNHGGMDFQHGVVMSVSMLNTRVNLTLEWRWIDSFSKFYW